MIIREILDNELEALAQIDKSVNLSPWSHLNYEQSFTNEKHTIIGIFNNKQELIGGCAYSIVLDECEILQLCIAKNWQRKGYARQLLEFIFAEITQKQVRECFLEVKFDNLAAINLYQQAGFNIITRRKNYYLIDGERFDALIMGKSICLS